MTEEKDMASRAHRRMAPNSHTDAEPSASFTPGRWRAAIGYNGQHEVRGPGSNTVATVFHTPDGLGAANADLISAAPDLYEALKRCAGLLRDYAWAASPQGLDNADTAALNTADAALEKATGNTRSGGADRSAAGGEP